MIIFTFIFICTFNFGSGKVAHYSGAVIQEDNFNIFKTTAANKGLSQCSTKCNLDSDCEGYIYSANDESCSLGHFQATNLICPNGHENEIQIHFDEHSMEELVPDWDKPVRFAIFQANDVISFTHDQDDGDQFSIVNIQGD